MNGWIKLHRVLIDKPIWLTSTPEQKVILITILLMANHNESEWEWMGERFKVKPGEFVTSLESIRQKAGKEISIQNVRSAIVRFKKLEFLTEKATKTGRLISICNWESYQDDQIPTQQSNRQTGNKEVTTNKNDKKEKNNISVIFEEFRKAYPGRKRGFDPEFENFKKRLNGKLVSTVDLLMPALQKEIADREKSSKAGTFVPEWKNLQTWINQQCWTQEFSEISVGAKPQLHESINPDYQ